MNKFANSCNLILSLYKYIVLYIINLSSHVHEFVHEYIIMFEFDSFNNCAYSWDWAWLVCYTSEHKQAFSRTNEIQSEKTKLN